MSHCFMDDHEELQGDHPTSFSQLLFGDDDVVLGVDHHQPPTLPYSSLFSIGNPPKMLCFGDDQNGDVEELLLSDANAVTLTVTTTPQKSVVTSSESSSASSSCNHNSNNHKKRNGSGQEPLRCSDSVVTAVSGGRRQPKKTKAENPGSAGHAKRKEKLGERIAALQQLVSPFGKTDTASVLHEAMGYIRFLHDQVQVLCSPYLQRLPSSFHHHHHQQPGDGENKRDLRSRGLCLIPVESTVHVASSNGADFWSPAMGSNTNYNNVSSSRQ